MAASACTSAGPLSLKQNGVYTKVTTSGCTNCPLRTQPTVVEKALQDEDGGGGTVELFNRQVCSVNGGGPDRKVRK